MSCDELDELVVWLHEDLDECLIESEDLQAYLKYQQMFSYLDLLKKDLLNAA
ncbi:hypothetical protein [Vibrio sp. F74]|uniref:hypothetical protein n=1 Tax=Vibrio sp. F74 TaxID=700020 RepID=UPI0035F55B88